MECLRLDGGIVAVVDAEEKLRIDFADTNEVQSLRLGGRSVTGLVSAETHPEYLIGEGAFWVEPKGTVILFQ